MKKILLALGVVAALVFGSAVPANAAVTTVSNVGTQTITVQLANGSTQALPPGGTASNVVSATVPTSGCLFMVVPPEEGRLIKGRFLVGDVTACGGGSLSLGTYNSVQLSILGSSGTYTPRITR